MKLILKGNGVCKGTVSGKVKIIKDVTNLSEIEDGTILVMPFSTPIISILMHKAKGIITDFGGTTCHAAVIAREFGIPCIAGVENATQILKDGQEICLDGEKGEIYETNKLNTFLDSFTNAILEVTKGSYGGKWPMPHFTSMEVGMVIDECWCEYFLYLIKQLNEKGLDLSAISSKLKYPSPLSRAFMANIQLKYKKYPADKIIKIGKLISELMYPLYKKDQFCMNWTNMLWDEKQISERFQRQNLIQLEQIPDNYKSIASYGGFLRILSEMLFFYFDNMGHEVHGPYYLDNGEILLIKDWHDLKADYFEFSQAFPHDHIRIYEVHKTNTQIKIDISNRVCSNSRTAESLVGFYFEVEGRILTLAETQVLVENIRNICWQGSKELSSLTSEQLLEKAAHMHFYILKPFTDMLNISHKPPAKCMDKVKNGLTDEDRKISTCLMRTKLDETAVRQLFDPRLNLPPTFHE